MIHRYNLCYNFYYGLSMCGGRTQVTVIDNTRAKRVSRHVYLDLDLSHAQTNPNVLGVQVIIMGIRQADPPPSNSDY